MLGVNDKNLWAFPHLSWALAELLFFLPYVVVYKLQAVFCQSITLNSTQHSRMLFLVGIDVLAQYSW